MSGSTAQRLLAPRNISAVYILIGLVVVFGLLRPTTFLTQTTLNSLLSEQALTALVAVGLVVPLAAGMFDLSLGGSMALASVTSATLATKHELGTYSSIMVAVVIGTLVGTLTGLLVSKANISSFIATLGMGSVLLASSNAVSNQLDIIGLPKPFIDLGQDQWLGIRLVVWICLAVVVAMWFFTEQTPTGRQMYAIGGNLDAARLSGIRVDALRIVALAVSAGIAAFAGVLATAGITAGSSQTGPSYLLPAFAAVFLGSTQITPGRVNVWGTVLAVFTLAVGVKGLQLMGAPFWLSDLFNGVALLVAVGLASNNVAWRTRMRKARLSSSQEAQTLEKAL